MDLCCQRVLWWVFSACNCVLCVECVAVRIIWAVASHRNRPLVPMVVPSALDSVSVVHTQLGSAAYRGTRPSGFVEQLQTHTQPLILCWGLIFGVLVK